MSKGVTLWFTGLSGSGKTTVARRVHETLQARHILSERLDGDVVRQSLCRDLGFSKEDRDKNIERVTFVSNILTRNGVVVLSCFISPYKRMRDNARAEIGDFLEIYVRTPMDVLVERDVKGMYKKAMAGEIQGFTGVNDPYEEPTNPELILDTDRETVEESADKVIRLLEERGYLAKGLGTFVSVGDRAEASRKVEAAKKVAGPSTPHGGTLVNRELAGDKRLEAIDHAKALKTLVLDEREMSDLEMIGYGALSPLTGFMRRADYETVVDSMRLSDNLVWAMPVTKAVSVEEARSVKEGQEVALTSADGRLLGIMQVTDIYAYDKAREAQQCFGTTETAHPGVARLMAQGEMLLGGPVQVVNRPDYDLFTEYRLTPLETRQRFDELGWKTVVAFQTRNPVHRAHEYLQKVAMEMWTGCSFIHSLGPRSRMTCPLRRG
jgi:sulfate adenylyltransferase/3'-phosphoadenosine 5'-phosphosulfate synthase